jgi:protein-disulfide isomerase
VQVVWKNLPLPMHPNAKPAAAAAEAAHKQGKFWEMHDLIFANQRELSGEKYDEFAKKIGLDIDRFKKDLVSADVKKRLSEDGKEAQSLGVTGTPCFFINGRFMKGAQPFEKFKAIIDEELGRS